MYVDVVAPAPVGLPRSHDLGRVEVVDHPGGTDFPQDPVDQARRHAKVTRRLAECEQLHRTQSRSASRVHSSPAFSEPLTLGASGCSDSGFAATVPSSRNANAMTSDGETSSSTYGEWVVAMIWVSLKSSSVSSSLIIRASSICARGWSE